MASTVWKLHHSTSFWPLPIDNIGGRISHLSQPCLASTLNNNCVCWAVCLHKVDECLVVCLLLHATI